MSSGLRDINIYPYILGNLFFFGVIISFVFDKNLLSLIQSYLIVDTLYEHPKYKMK